MNAAVELTALMLSHAGNSPLYFRKQGISPAASESIPYSHSYTDFSLADEYQGVLIVLCILYKSGFIIMSKFDYELNGGAGIEFEFLLSGIHPD